jgi:hypothetical protein
MVEADMPAAAPAVN